MMEVGTNGGGLELPSAKVATMVNGLDALAENGTSEPVTTTVAAEAKENGTNGTADVTGRAESPAAGTTKQGPEEEDEEMERLLLSDPEDEDSTAADKPAANDTEVQNISDTLIEDIIALNKDSKRTDEEEEEEVDEPVDDRIADQEQSSDVPPSSVQTGTEEDDTNGGTELEEEEDALLGEEEDCGETVAEVDESLLLEDGEEGVEGSGSAIQIEDTAVELTDSSIAVVDESAGLSILNTAAVDITDELGDSSLKVVGEEAQEPPVFAMMEEMVTSIADNLKAGANGEVKEVDETQQEPMEEESRSSESGELIKFPDVDESVEQTEQKEAVDAPEEASTVDEPEPEVSDLIKFNSAPSIEDVEKPEESDLIKFSTIVASQKDKPELQVSDLIKFSTDSVPEVSSASDIPEAPREEAEETIAQKIPAEPEVSTSGQEVPEGGEEETDENGQDVCPKALQAADEEDLLEMMEEPERGEDANDGEPADEEDDLEDDQSSEFGSAKQSHGDGDEEEGDFEGSEFGGAEDPDEGSNSRPEAEIEVEEGELELEDGEPPSKRKCSVDVREEPEVTTEKQDTEEQEKASESPEAEEVKAVEKETVEEVATETEDKSQAEEKIDAVEEKPEIEVPAEKTPVETHIEDSEKEPEKMETSESEEPAVEDAQSTDKVEVEEPAKKNDAEAVVEEDKKEPEASPEPEKPAEKDAIEIVDLEEKKDEQQEKQPEVTEDSAKVDESKKSSSEEPANKETPKEEAKKPEPAAAAVEVLVIDDDDDVPASSEEPKKDDAPIVPGKRPCPEDESEKADESTKKIRLSVEEVVTVEDSKKEPEKPKEEKKSALESIEPLEIQLDPQPEPLKEPLKPVRLDFLAKFKKPLEKMNRTDLEEFVLQKIVEGIAFKSTIAEMRTQLDSQDQLLQGYRQKVHDLNKQFKDLEMVHERVMKDLEKKNQHFITPVKITRAVGLQVSQPRFAQNQRQSLLNTSTTTASTGKGAQNRSPAASPAPAGSPNKNSPQANAAQNRRLSYTRTPQAVVTAKTATPPVATPQNRPGMAAKSPLNSAPSTPVNRGITPVQTVTTPQTQQQQQPQPTTPLPSNVMMRKKPLQKFTPMRPPMSLTQQVQQQQQTRQMQEQLLRQQIQEVQTSGSAPGSPQVQSPQGSPLTRTPEPASSPGVGGPSSTRVPPIVMKKVTPQAKGTPTTMQIINRPGVVASTTVVRIPPANAPAPAPAAPQQVAASTAAPVDNSMIDLTDDDDLPRPQAPPTAVAPPAQVVPKSPITLINGQQQRQAQQQQQAGMPPLVVINQQRLMNRPQLQQRPMPTMLNGAQQQRPMLMQRPGNSAAPANGAYGPRSMVAQQTYKPRALTNRQMAEVNQRVMARGPMRQQVTTTAVVSYTHPAALPQPGPQPSNPGWKVAPPRPSIRINNIETGIVISWTMDDLSEIHAQIVSYQIYAYQETTAPPASDMWRHVGDVKAMLLPMAVTLTQFQEGQRYHFAVRAVDEHQRVGHFSPPRTWNESTPGKA
uniref:Putative activating transcription factor 7-interacting protein 1 n=1 Tax=Culex tarsalis TaxID=7177 RepID=A0A1Q3EY88_CULTA